MIENDAQLNQTTQSLVGLESALRALRVRVEASNPALFVAMAEDYYGAIQSMRAEIDAYLGVGESVESAAPLWMVLEGEDISHREISSRLLSEWLERFRKAVYGVSAFLRDGTTRLGGRPEAILLGLTDPKVVALQPGSIRVGLRFSNSATQAELFETETGEQATIPERAVQRLMEVAFAAATGAIEGTLSDLNRRDEVAVVARYAATLAPTQRSVVRTVTFSGALVPAANPLRLNAETRVHLDGMVQLLARVSEETVIGHVREIDLDARRLTLRERGPGMPDLKCLLPPELMSLAERFLDTSVRVRGLIASSAPDTMNVLSIVAEGAA